MHNKNGFTLLELMVVVAIIAILSAIAIPNVFAWMSNRRILNTTNELHAAFQLARSQALRENADVVIRIDTGSDECEVFIDNGRGGGTARNQVRDGTEAQVALLSIPEGVDMYNQTFALPWCGYDSRGIPINNNTGQIHLRNTAGVHTGVALNIAGNPRIIQSYDNGSNWH